MRVLRDYTGCVSMKPALCVDQKLSHPFTKWSLDQHVYLFSMTLVYALVHSHIYVSVGKGPLKLFKLYCSGIIFKFSKKNISPHACIPDLTLAQRRHPYSQGD